MNEQFVTISFGLLNEGSIEFTTCSNWKVEDGNLGLFVLQSNQELQENYRLEFSMDSSLLWSSPIRLAPKKGLNITSSRKDELLYISSKVIRSEDLPYGDGLSEILLLDEDKEIAVAVIDIEDARVSYTDCNEEEILHLFTEEPLVTDSLENTDTFFTDISEDNVYKEASLHSEDISEENNAENFECPEEDIMEQTEYEETNMESYVIYVNESEPVDLKTELFKSISGFIPLKVFVNPFDKKEFNTFRKGIVIEKLGNFYATVLNGFLNRPVYFLYNGEQMVEWNDSFEDYLKVMKGNLSKMYNMPSDEFDQMEKLVIVENQNQVIDGLDCNIVWIPRNQAIQNLCNKYDAIFDLTIDSLTLYVNGSKENIRIEIDELGLGNFTGALILKNEDAFKLWAEKADGLFAALSDKPVLLLGLSSLEVLQDKLLHKPVKAVNIPFISLAWEV